MSCRHVGTDEWTDTQNFGRYYIIPLPLFVAGHKKMGIPINVFLISQKKNVCCGYSAKSAWPDNSDGQNLGRNKRTVTLKMPRKPTSENVVYLSSAEYSCKLFKPIFAYRQAVWTLIRLLLEEQSFLGPHYLQK